VEKAVTSLAQPGIPHGQLKGFTLEPGEIYPGVPHNCQVYVPTRYVAETPSPYMVFLDGIWLFLEQLHVSAVLDELIAHGDVPPLIGIFVDPGVLPVVSDETQQNRVNRHFEYDAITGRFAGFLVAELIPRVGREYNLSQDPNEHGVAGISSSAVAAFMAAWERPEHFRRVLGCIGTFVDMLGANVLPSWIRKTEPKPLRVFLQETTGDQNSIHGSWPLQNEAMRSALEFARYDHALVVGGGGHDLEHATAILPDALRWLWREYPRPITPPTAGPIFDTILYPDQGWQQVGDTYTCASNPAADKQGNVFFADPTSSRIYTTVADGSVAVFKEGAVGAKALKFGPDGRLYAIQPSLRRVVSYGAAGDEDLVAENLDARDLALTAAGAIYVTDPVRKTIVMIDAARQRSTVYRGGEIAAPTALAISPDQAFLDVMDAESKFGWSFQISPDGALINGEPLFRMEWSEEVNLRGVEAIAVDTSGELYTPTAMGIALSTQTGRNREIIRKPEWGTISSVGFGGPQRDWLYVTENGKLFRRHIRRTGAVVWEPTKPPMPKL
jgi:gluconolactonase